MKEFTDLVETIDMLLSDTGCVWSRSQTLKSLQPYLLEELHEVLEAIDRDLDQHIMEEVGDVLYTLLFCVKIAEKDKRFFLNDVLLTIREKLIRRHPHVFADSQANTVEEIAENWQKIKKKEKRGALQGIPDRLSSLTRAQKIMHCLKSNRFPGLNLEVLPLETEEQIAKSLMDILLTANVHGIDVEGALRRRIAHLQDSFESWEGLGGCYRQNDPSA